jgi:hypothetical protein
MTGIFISYRRIDSRVYAGRLFDRLARHFGPRLLFMDIEGGISRGADYVDAIGRAVADVDAMVVVIGHHWSKCTDDQGLRRLDNEDDWVRQEIVAALRRDILVLPVLVGGATMPRAEDLPDDIRALARKQAAEISDSRWDYDTAEIFKTLQRVVKPGSDAQRPRSATLRKLVRGFFWTLAGMAALIAAIYVYAFFDQPKPGDYAVSVDPPQVRISRSAANDDVQEVELTVRNTGRRAARLMLHGPEFNPRLSSGVFSLELGTCTDQKIAAGDVCKAKLVFRPRWLNSEERERDIMGSLTPTASGNGGDEIPISITVRP